MSKIDPQNKEFARLVIHPLTAQRLHPVRLLFGWNPHLTAFFIPHYTASVSVGIPTCLAKIVQGSIKTQK